MKHTYTPRRAGKTRWLKDAPEYILDCFDHPGEDDRYTIMLTGTMLCWSPVDKPRTFANTEIQFIGSTAGGSIYWSGVDAYRAAQYRYAKSRHRVRWLDLPEAVREQVVIRVTQP